MFQISKSSTDLTPFVLYPGGNTVWLVTIKTSAPVASQILNFTVAGGAQKVATLNGTIVNSVVFDSTLKRLWLVENNTLAYYDPALRSIVPAVTFPADESPEYMELDSQDHLWLTLAGSNRIAVYNPSISGISSYYNVPTASAGLQGITISPTDNSVWFAEAAAKKIGHIQCASCAPVEYSPPAEITLSAPVQIVVALDGLVWFTDHGSNQFGNLNPATGEWKVFPVGYCAGDCAVGLPNAISLDSHGKLWISEHIAGRIARYDPITGQLTEYLVPGTASSFTWWMWPGEDDRVWFTSFGLGKIGYVNSSMPVPLSISTVSSLSVLRGNSQKINASVTFQGSGTLSLALSATTQDAPPGASVPFLSGVADPSQLGANPAAQQSSITISSASNSTVGPRYVAVTASNGYVTVNSFVRVTVADNSNPYSAALPYAIAGILVAIVAGTTVIILRRRRKTRPTVPVRKNIRRN